MQRKPTARHPRARSPQARRPRQTMPAFVRRALTERGLTAAYRSRPPYQRNDYLLWITKAKLEATQTKRLGQMLRELAGGRRYMNMAWGGTNSPARRSAASKRGASTSTARVRRAAKPRGRAAAGRSFG